MIEFVPAPPTPPTTLWWCAYCALICFVTDESRCTGCAGELTVMLPAVPSVSLVRLVAQKHQDYSIELEDPAGAMLPLIRTPEDLCRWLAAVVGSPGAELDAAIRLSLEAELQEVARHLLHELGEGEARLGRLEATIREAAVHAGLPLVVTTEAGRVVELSPGDLALALGEAAARGREAAPVVMLMGTLTPTHGLEVLAEYEAGAPARPADPTTAETTDA